MSKFERVCTECGEIDHLVFKPKSIHCKKCSTRLCGEKLKDESKTTCTTCGAKKSYAGTECRECTMKRLNQNKRVGVQEIHRRANEKGIEILTSFETNACIVELRCFTCDYIWSTTTGNIINKAKGCPKCTKLKGEFHPNWDSSISDEERVYKRGYAFIAWSKVIKEIAEYKCDICNSGGYLESHHLESYAKNVKLRYDLSNGVCLCRECHYTFHQEYGYRNSTKAQYLDFKGVTNG